MKRRRIALPAWGSCLTALVLIAQAGSPSMATPPLGSLGGSRLSSAELWSTEPVGVTSNGIAIVGPDAIQARPADEAQATAFNAALELAYAHRNDLGYPWLDPESGLLELSFASALGETVAASAVDQLSADGLTVRLRPAPTSIGELDALADKITRLNVAEVPGADGIWMTEPDQKNNRIVVTVSEAPEELLDALAARFDTERIAVRIKPRESPSTASRDTDAPPFWGGAFITTRQSVPGGQILLNCTTGFAWNAGGQAAMLTAAHCISRGGSVSYPSYPNAGTVRSGSEENWDDTYGTQYYTGQSVYRGDVALIRYGSSYGSAPYVYSGAPGSSTWSTVTAMASRRSQVGDAACVNGVVTGQWCGMVTATGVNAWYLVNGVNVWARNVVRAEALGNTCPTHGDSGAPVYRIVSTGRVAAVGIFSGSFPQVVACSVWFTDIWDAYYGLPGSLKTAG
ncbi:MAG TPA: hypothetical protein VNO86_11735 [Candidatus Binatia bacterium]|nr:hypothetical protein [Candidatus Binatia bacterium]